MKTLSEMLQEFHFYPKYASWKQRVAIIWGDMPVNEKKFTSEIINEIKKCLQSKNEILLSNLLVISNIDGFDNRFSNILCHLLEQQWHRCHENIVAMLEDIKDNTTIICLYKTALNIPDYDDARALAKKCIWALVAINTSEAIEKLFLLTKIDDEIIREAACEQLGYLGYM